MLTADQLDGLFEYLIRTDEEVARCKSYMLGVKKQEDTIIAVEVLKQKGKLTVQEKNAVAKTSAAYITWLEDYRASVYDYEIIKNRRTTKVLEYERWRSEFAARRQGQIV